MPRKIQKQFPANTEIKIDEESQLIKTFLNDNKVDAELYGYLLSKSIGDKELGRTVVYKSNLDSWTYVTKEILHYKSRQTLYNHLNYLIQQGYIEEEKDRYILPDKEKMYFKIPVDLLNYFIDTLKEPVLKTYIYLGQRYNYKLSKNETGYIFSIKELCDHFGLDYCKKGSTINNYLSILTQLKLITMTQIWVNEKPMMKLLSVSKEVPTILLKK